MLGKCYLKTQTRPKEFTKVTKTENVKKLKGCLT